MKLLDFDPESGGRTWRNPARLDLLIARSPYQQAAILISGQDLIASTGPVLEHLELMFLGGIRYGESRDTTDTQVDGERFCEADIGMLRGQATSSTLAIELELGANPDPLLPPAVDTVRLDMVIALVGLHRHVRAAWPKGVEVTICLSCGPGFRNRWAYQAGGTIHPHE